MMVLVLLLRCVARRVERVNVNVKTQWRFPKEHDLLDLNWKKCAR